MDHLCYFCLVLLCFHVRLFVDALWSLAGKGLTSWLSFVMSANCDVVTFPIGILGQVWCLIVWIPDLCPLFYFESENPENTETCPSYQTLLTSKQLCEPIMGSHCCLLVNNINSTDCICVSTVLSNAIIPNLYALAHLPDVICRDSSRLTKILHSYTIIILIVKMLC